MRKSGVSSPVADHLLSPPIDQFNVHIDWPSSTPRFFFQRSLEKCMHISLFLFHVRIGRERERERKNIEGLIMVVSRKTRRVIDENTCSFSFHLVVNTSEDNASERKCYSCVFLSSLLLEAICRRNDWRNLLIRFRSNPKCQQASVTKSDVSNPKKKNIITRTRKRGWG